MAAYEEINEHKLLLRKIHSKITLKRWTEGNIIETYSTLQCPLFIHDFRTILVHTLHYKNNFKCDLCDTDYVGYTCRYLYQCIEEHKGSTIAKHVRDQHGRDPSDISLRFKILWKGLSKFDCLIDEMFFIKELKPTLKRQSDFIRRKLFL